jgi:FkbM family methyltransferase
VLGRLQLRTEKYSRVNFRKRIVGALARFIMKVGSLMPFKLTMGLVRLLLESQGFGSGARIDSSGEIRAAQQFLSGDHERALVVLDIGANRGEYTEAIVKVFPGATVHAFEPSTETYSLLRTSLRNQKNVQLHNFALGNVNDRVPLYKENHHARIASLSPLDVTKDHLTEQVQIHRLDDIFKTLGLRQVDLAKIDVEGHEMDVLLGAEQAIKSGKISHLQFELGGSSIDTNTTLKMFFEFLSEYRYDLFLIRKSGPLHLSSYKYLYEQYSTTNFFAALRA